MNFFVKTLAVTLALNAGFTVAHAQDSTNPAVIARHDLMRTIGKNSKVLGDMAGGKAAFDAAAAATAKSALATAAAAIPATYEANEQDAGSKAKPEIWTNWPDFLVKAEALLAAAEAMDTGSVEGLQAGMAGVGGACSGCHKVYRN